ncbi:gap repair protein [uncultured Alphaproteobacteria bacterium]|uniref:Recombination protein RecR n=1 Tax=uncultured Alphaproteobacteria bacterium TaxID=91750 RepID=A0A212KKV2_9PROT|nr:gap repair protein [uncultured Alphaproteobacteria bacterium]
MSSIELERLVAVLAKLPGLGPRSARRAVLHLLRKRESLGAPLLRSLEEVLSRVKPCSVCGNYDTEDPCEICADPRRDDALLCVVPDVADVWALERTAAFRGRYHVLGGLLSPLDGVGPEELDFAGLLRRLDGRVQEVILALPATVDGQTTAHYAAERLEGSGVRLTAPAHGLPVGGELEFLDDGTIAAALRARRRLE